jgi:hypothetical protein
VVEESRACVRGITASCFFSWLVGVEHFFSIRGSAGRSQFFFRAVWDEVRDVPTYKPTITSRQLI